MTSQAEQLTYHPEKSALAFTWGAGQPFIQVWGAHHDTGDLMIEVQLQLDTELENIDFEQEPFETFCRKFLGLPSSDVLQEVESIIGYVEGEDQDDEVVLDKVMDRLFDLREALK